jgi:DNA-binding MarR family transcriptional regulator
MRRTATSQREATRNRRPIPKDIETATWVRLAHAYHHIIRRLEQALDEHSISLAQFEVLAHLHYEPGIVQNDLARRLLVTKGNVCGLLDRLTAAQLVRRVTAPDDRRVNRLFLTNSGQQVIAQTLPVHLAIIKKLLGKLSRADLSRLRALLERLETRVSPAMAE